MSFNKKLTPRECEVVLEVRKGHTNRIIAEVMGISVPTVKDHMTSIMRKVGVVNRTQVAVHFSRAELSDH